jgi:hypothetical protein
MREPETKDWRRQGVWIVRRSMYSQEDQTELQHEREMEAMLEKKIAEKVEEELKEDRESKLQGVGASKIRHAVITFMHATHPFLLPACYCYQPSKWERPANNTPRKHKEINV